MDPNEEISINHKKQVYTIFSYNIIVLILQVGGLASCCAQFGVELGVSSSTTHLTNSHISCMVVFYYLLCMCNKYF